MRKPVWPFVVIVLAILAAGAWFAFPQKVKAAGTAASSLFKSFTAEAKTSWSRHFPKKGNTEATDDDPKNGDASPDPAPGANAPTIPTELGSIADPASDPDPATLSREQRKRRHKELVAAAEQRKREVMLAGLKKSPAGMEALKATRNYRAKVDELEKLEAHPGRKYERIAQLRIELVHLKESVRVANSRYKAWKDAHPGEIADPMADKLYCDLIARSRFYKD